MGEEKLNKKIILVSLINFLIRLPFLNFPAHWDEVTYYNAALTTLRNNLNPFIEYWSYKPPLFFEITALLYHFFGTSRWGAHLIVAFSSSLVLFLTYKLGKKLFNARVGLWAAILLFLNPLYFTQSNLYHLEIFLTALFLLTTIFYFKNRLTWYLLFASLMVLTKEPAVLVIIAIVFFDIISNMKNLKARELIVREFILMSPLVVFIAWMLLNKHFLGWYLWPYNVAYFTFQSPDLRPEFSSFFAVSFQDHLMWFIYGLPLFSLFISMGFDQIKKRIYRRELIFLFGLAIFFPFFFYFSAFLPRYSLFTYPGLFLSFVWMLDRIFKKRRRVKTAIIALVCATFASILLNSYIAKKPLNWAGERDMSYIHYVQIHKNIVAFVESNYPGITIITGNPTEDIFRNKLHGYVDSQFNLIAYKNCQQLNQITEKALLIGSLDENVNRTIEACAYKRNLQPIHEIQSVKIFYLQERRELP